MRPVKIGDRLVGDNYPCYIVAEAGINHNGDVTLARKLVDAAAEAGADAIKFQTHLPEKEMLPDTVTADYVGEPLFDLLKRLELSRDDHIEIMDHAGKRGILFLSTPFSGRDAFLNTIKSYFIFWPTFFILSSASTGAIFSRTVDISRYFEAIGPLTGR